MFLKELVIKTTKSLTLSKEESFGGSYDQLPKCGGEMLLSSWRFCNLFLLRSWRIEQTLRPCCCCTELSLKPVKTDPFSYCHYWLAFFCQKCLSNGYMNQNSQSQLDSNKRVPLYHTSYNSHERHHFIFTRQRRQFWLMRPDPTRPYASSDLARPDLDSYVARPIPIVDVVRLINSSRCASLE